MSYEQRIKLYQKIIEHRKKPLLTYVTSIRPFKSMNMDSDAIESIVTQIDAIPEEHNSIDFLIISNGGDPITSLRIISILRERFEQVSVLVPYVAYSAATVLALGANEIVMHPYSNLGPVDPQLTISKTSGDGIRTFSSEDIAHFVTFLKNDIGITDQEYLMNAFLKLSDSVDPVSIGFVKRSQQLTFFLSKKMLETHMSDENKIKEISKALNTSFYNHAYAVDRKEAESIGLPIAGSNPEIEKLLWSVWLDFADEMQCNKAFNLLSELMKHEEVRKFMNEVPCIEVPAGLPENKVNDFYSKILNDSKIIRNPVQLKHLLVSIESINFAKQLSQIETINYWRDSNLNFQCNGTSYIDDWIKVEAEN